MHMNSTPPEVSSADIEIMSDVSTVSDMNLGELTLEENWSSENMLVRYLDWAESLPEESRVNNDELQDVLSEIAANEHPDDVPAHLGPDESFEVILGTDVIYEDEHAKLVAAVLHHRLVKHGKGLVAGAVREQVRPNGKNMILTIGSRLQCAS